ncbi:MAG: hypothetical protein HKN76_05960 [Saprospiraceae bacterium]|nr:hypothetical protein [Saprospiraceae bacterium]
MTFFDYPIYKIPEPGEVILLSPDKPVTVLVKKSQYLAKEAELLSKILKAVQIAPVDVTIIEGKDDQYYRIESGDQERLFLLFGLDPGDCGLQIDFRKYSLIQRGKNSFIFGSPLVSLPDLPDERRALWLELKRFYNIP